MRVLMVTSSYPKFPGDGTAPFIERIALAVARLGHEVDLVLPRHPELVLAGRDGGLPLRFFTYRAGPSRPHLWGYATSMEADRVLRPATVLLAPFVSLAAVRRLRRLVKERRYDVVHAHWAVPSGALAAIAASRKGPPLVISAHGSDVFVAERNPVLRAFARGALRRSAWVTACSRDLAERTRALGRLDREVTVLPYGVELADPGTAAGAAWRARLEVGPSEFLVVALGRLVAKKGFSVLVRAAGRLRAEGVPLRVAIGGVGDLRESLEHDVREAGGGDAIRLLGNVPHTDVAGLLAAADAVAVPSVRDDRGNVDGLPNVLLEALAAGKPVVASSIAGIPDVVRDGENGILVAPGEAEALAGALRRLRESEPLRERIAAGAKRTSAGLSWEAYARRLVAGYRRASASSGSGDAASGSEDAD